MARASRRNVSVKLDEETLGRIRTLQPKLSTPWSEATCSDVMRALLYLGLNAIDQEGIDVLLSQLGGEDDKGAAHDKEGGSR